MINHSVELGDNRAFTDIGSTKSDEIQIQRAEVSTTEVHGWDFYHLTTPTRRSPAWSAPTPSYVMSLT
jgi:hypothetical protein